MCVEVLAKLLKWDIEDTEFIIDLSKKWNIDISDLIENNSKWSEVVSKMYKIHAEKIKNIIKNFLKEKEVIFKNQGYDIDYNKLMNYEYTDIDLTNNLKSYNNAWLIWYENDLKGILKTRDFGSFLSMERIVRKKGSNLKLNKNLCDLLGINYD